MKTADIESVANRQSRRYCAGIPMNTSILRMFSSRNSVRVVPLIARG